MKREKSIAVFSLLLFWFFLLSGPAGAAEEVLIGIVMTGNTLYYSAMHEAFTEGLKGRTPAGKQIRLIVQKPFPDAIALSNAARKLIAADVDLIVSYGSPATLAVMHETNAIPLVYAGVYDPEAAHIAGRRITGCGYKIPLSSLLRHLRSLKQFATLSVIYSSLEEDSVRQLAGLSDLAKDQGFVLQKINIRSQQDIKNIDPKTLGDALFVTGSSIVSGLLDTLLQVFKEHGHPSVGLLPDATEAGIVITLYQNPQEQGGKAAEMVARVLQGQELNSVKPEIFRNTDLVFNLREAKTLGMKPPINLIAESTRVIK